MADEMMWAQHGAPQIVKVRRNGFSAAKRTKFLDALALTCNMKRSAEYAGICQSTAYRIRRDDAHFAAQILEAIEIGRERLKLMVIEHGGAGMELPPPDPATAEAEMAAGEPPPPFDFERAMAVLKLTEPASRGERRGSRTRRATSEETNEKLVKAIDAARRRLGALHDDG